MNKYWLSGIIFLAYGLASPAFSSETATLAINGRISPPTCSMAMVNGQPQQHCGQLTYNVDTRHLFSSPVKGVTTEVVVAGSDSKRRIVLRKLRKSTRRSGSRIGA
ncbi:YehE family protein [Escherichia coli]|uniref:YehE family protein n=1 Tax=Escherichia coli TaxID=562 RepID=UPI00298F2FAD|nr:YehE family protein [Escherichia coli]